MTRHAFDPFSALAGLLCIGLAATVVLRPGPLSLEQLQLAGPLALLLLGLTLVLGGGRRRETSPATASPDPGSEPEQREDPADEEPGDGGDGQGGQR